MLPDQGLKVPSQTKISKKKENVISYGVPLPPPSLRSTRWRLDGPPDSPTSSPPPAGAMATPEEEGVDEEGFCFLALLATAWWGTGVL